MYPAYTPCGLPLPLQFWENRQPPRPPGPPPAVMPPKPVAAPGTYFAVDPQAMEICLFSYTVIYPTGRPPFWAWPMFVGPTSVAGVKWSEFGFGWVPFGMDLLLIDYFECV